MSPIVIVGVSDDAALVREATAMTVVRAGQAASGACTQPDLAKDLSAHEYLSRTVCGIALSEEGRNEIISLERHLKGIHDEINLPLIDLSQKMAEIDPPAHGLLKELVPILLAKIEHLSRRNVNLMGANSELRHEYARLQRSFVQLERAASEGGKLDRKQFLSLPPHTSDNLQISLSEGETLSQRLPRDSAGLSDVAIYIGSKRFEQDGSLEINLVTLENAGICKTWKIAAADLKPGWLRLALPASLGPDRLTPQLSIAWHGKGKIWLQCAMQHPDERFLAAVNDKPHKYVLAMQLWTSLPDVAPPPAVGAHLPSGTVAKRYVVSAEDLKEAVCLNEVSEYFTYMEEFDGLRVHALEEGIAAGLLKDIVPSAVRTVRARVKTVHTDAPSIEYALAVAPKDDRIGGQDKLPNFARGLRTPWVTVAPMTDVDLVLPIDEHLDEPHDLYLMTRLPDDVDSASCAWAIFERIEMICDADQPA